MHSWNAIVWFVVLAAVVGSWTRSKRRSSTSVGGSPRRPRSQTTLRYQNDMKNTLLHAVSHDLKGPLAGVLGAMQTIRRAEKLHLTDKEMEDLYGVIEQAGAKAARLVEDLLDLDRLDRGQIEPQREPTDVESIADRLAGELPTPRRPPGTGRRRATAGERRCDDDRAHRREPAEQRRAAHAPGHPDPRRGRGRLARRGRGGRGRGTGRARRDQGHDLRAVPAGRERARAAWASACLSSAGSPSCTAGRRTSRIATVAAPASWCGCPAT